MNTKLNVITYLRSRLGKTQKQVARETGLTENDISRLEKGNLGVGIGKLKTLAEYFATPMYPLIGSSVRLVLPYLHGKADKTTRMYDTNRKIRDQNDAVGLTGEVWVYKEERKKLENTPYHDAVNPNYADESEAHFDILSFDPQSGEEIIIEVKATSGEPDTPFTLTAPELELMLDCIDAGLRYELHRVSYVNDPDKRTRTIYTPRQILDEFDCKAVTYRFERRKN